MKNEAMALATAAAAALALSAVPSSALAWGDDGHKIVCMIAYRLLEPTVQQKIDDLTGTFRRPGQNAANHTPMFTSFSDACTFADTARRNARKSGQAQFRPWRYFKRFEEWHFLNVPRDARTVEAKQCGDNCVLRGIDYHSARLAKADIPDWQRAESLFFLGHWIGDIHQPLHVSFKDDAGGNEITPISGNFFTSDNLHAVWDSGIITMAHAGSDATYAKKLTAAITPEMQTEWLAVDPVGWAQESYDITVSDKVAYCEWTHTPNPNDEESCVPEPMVGRTLGQAYETRFRPTVELRLQKAGVRLADRIRRALGS